MVVFNKNVIVKIIVSVLLISMFYITFRFVTKPEILELDEIKIKNDVSGIPNYSMQYNVYLFAENRDGTASLLSQMQLYSFKLYENNSLVRNFAPCYNKDTSVIGLYDTVTKLFYTNAGSGTFIKGQDHEYTQSSSRVNIYRNHTLYALWEEN